jgi:hypothetical protein
MSSRPRRYPIDVLNNMVLTIYGTLLNGCTYTVFVMQLFFICLHQNHLLCRVRLGSKDKFSSPKCGGTYDWRTMVHQPSMHATPSQNQASPAFTVTAVMVGTILFIHNALIM